MITRKLTFISILGLSLNMASAADLEEEFRNPPDSARPGVYWYFMDGNLSREGMTADLESMKAVGIGNLVFLEVNVGVPRGPVRFNACFPCLIIINNIDYVCSRLDVEYDRVAQS